LKKKEEEQPHLVGSGIIHKSFVYLAQSKISCPSIEIVNELSEALFGHGGFMCGNSNVSLLLLLFLR
jgi:hypothetical protein